jgi:hypothetical protein
MPAPPPRPLGKIRRRRRRKRTPAPRSPLSSARRPAGRGPTRMPGPCEAHTRRRHRRRRRALPCPQDAAPRPATQGRGCMGQIDRPPTLVRKSRISGSPTFSGSGRSRFYQRERPSARTRARRFYPSHPRPEVHTRAHDDFSEQWPATRGKWRLLLLLHSGAKTTSKEMSGTPLRPTARPLFGKAYIYSYVCVRARG